MKINKLFHWLYGALMLLPLFSILFTCLYVSFNPNAKDSWSGTTWTEIQPVYYESNEINTVEDLHMGNIYKFQYNNTYSGITTVIKCESIPFIYYTSRQLRSYTEYDTPPYFYLFVESNSNTLIVNQYLNNNSVNYNYTLNDTYLYFVLGQNTLQELNNILPYCSQTDYKLIKGYEQVEQQITLDNAFTYSLNDINQNPLYSWAQDSFLVLPIAYITSIFGLVSTSPIVTLLSYWLTISIVWLCFDLIMYVPLLVHRWIDKGILQ